MSHPGTQTNGASLEDCHANFFKLTDICGIQWIVYRESDCPSGTAKVSNGYDAVLSSFAKCLENDLLAVWRRVPKRSLLTCNFDNFGNPVKTCLSNAEEASFKDKNPVTQRKELWIFWYGDKPEDIFKRLVSPELKEVSDISGTWENVLPYEARTLLYKALNNLIERNLIGKDFVRLGKWFVQPFEGPEKTLQKASHLSFSFQYFVHGESFICASVDVRQHPAVRKLGPQHLASARGQANPLPVILAPFGLAATLTGVTYKSSDAHVAKLLQDWNRFYPLDRSRYTCQDNSGDIVTLAPAVEVIVAGVKMVYPTCYVFVTDLDSFSSAAGSKRSTFDMKCYDNNEPTPFTSSNHPLLSDFEVQLLPGSITEQSWQDGLTVNAESALSSSDQQQQQYHQQYTPAAATGTAPSSSTSAIDNMPTSELVSAWDFSFPGRYVKKKPRNKMREKSSKDQRIRFNSKVPFHKKADTVDELSWAMDQSDLLGGPVGPQNSGSGSNNVNNRGGSNSQMRGTVQPSLVSPAPGSVGGPVTPFTPKGGPGSVRTPGAPDLLSPPGAPPSNGPLTPMDMDSKNPGTPKSVPSYPMPSPFSAAEQQNKKPPTTSSSTTVVKSEILQSVLQQPPASSSSLPFNVKTELDTNSDEGGNEASNANATSSSLSSSMSSLSSFKRPALPMKEYEGDLETEHLRLSDTIYDTDSIKSWLNHPVKRFKPTDSRHNDPFKPLYRRQSQAELMTNSDQVNSVTTQNATVESLSNNDLKPNLELSIKQEPVSNGNANMNARFNSFGDPYEFGGSEQEREKLRAENAAKQNPDNDSLFTSAGLQPSIDDLENIFDDSSDETEGNGVGPTPPGSNKPNMQEGDTDITKLKQSGQSSKDCATLPHDQLAKMFPTPPSLEHPSPADGTMEVDHHIKMEPFSPAPDLTEWWITSGGSSEDMDVTIKSQFAPIKRLYSDTLPALNLPNEYKYKPRPRSTNQIAQNGPASSGSGGGQSNQGNNRNYRPGHHSATGTPLGTPTNVKMSPISPMTSVEGGPRSHGQPQASHMHQSQHELSSPSSSASNSLSKMDSSNKAENAVASTAPTARIPEASSLVFNLMLSDSILNVFRDHNFDSCTICVCSNEGNIRGRDAAPYLPNFSGDDEINCICGFSALMNRKLAHQSGLFYEDETEITGITEDLYHRKKTSLLLLDPKYNSNEDNNSNNDTERMNVVDSIPPGLMELIQEISVYNLSNSQSSLLKYAKQYLRNSSSTAAISMVDMMDSNYVAFNTLEKVKSLSEAGKLDEAQKGSCVHRWTLMQAPGPYCSEDIVRVMKSIQPLLNESLHVRSKMDKSKQQMVEGPLTWRKFHHMAGTTTKGNTDDQFEPLPVPAITVGHEQDFLSLAPQSLHHWESLSLEPYAHPRDVAYVVVCPESDFIVSRVKNFFKNLSCVYESCRLGRHVPITKIFKDNGILKVGKKYAEKVQSEQCDPWFEMIGESSTALLLKLYSQICRHYLLPVLLQLPLDRTLIESCLKQVLQEKTPPSPMPPPSSDYLNSSSGSSSFNSMSMDGSKFNKSATDEELLGKENLNSTSVGDQDDTKVDTPPAIIIYIVDPFSFGPSSDNGDVMRMTTLGLIRCFSQMLPNINDTLKANISLQLVSLESILEVTQSQQHNRMPSMMRGLAFSVFSQARKPVQYQRECKTLTGFGPASKSEKYLKENEATAKFIRHLHSPTFVLAPPTIKKKLGSDSDAFGSSQERSSVLFVNYCLSEDQHWLLASCCDDRGELVKTVTINIEIPNKTRRKKASARRVGLRKLMDWILSVMAMSLVPWRLVIGRIGRIGHGEIRGWSVLLSRKALKRSSKELRDICSWKTEVPCIMSACLVSMEPDAALRVMSDQFTPADDRSGQSSSNCPLSTPKDATCTHILVFPTSAKAQSSTQSFHDNREQTDDGDVGDIFGLPMEDFDIDPNNDVDMDIGNINDLFNDDNWDAAGGQPGSPRSPGLRNDISQPSSPKKATDQFKYGQEEPDERLDVLQQPLALGYMVSTAKTGPMPRWFWASCPHLENISPVFLKSALHINVASLIHGGDDGFAPQSSGRVHSLDSTYTADVLRYVLEGYNALSWLSLDFENHDRRSCLPIHVQVLLQMYNSLSALV